MRIREEWQEDCGDDDKRTRATGAKTAGGRADDGIIDKQDTGRDDDGADKDFLVEWDTGRLDACF